jgi:hypothetical protein
VTLLLHPEHAGDRVQQTAVGLLQGFDIDDAALRLFFDFDRLRFHHVGGLTHHLVRRVGDRLLQLECGVLPIETEQQDHLLFPNGNRKLRRGLQILDERLVTRLNDADLWKLLDPDLASPLQVKYPFLQAIQTSLL